MLRVAVMLLNGGSASTAVLPTEVFRHAGVFWNLIGGHAPEPRFAVTTATLDGGPARTDALISVTPQHAVADLERPDLVFVPAGGLEYEVLIRDGYDIDAVIAANAGLVPWLRRWADDGAMVAGVCSGVALLAEAGLLDGRRATAHWGLAHLYRERFPTVDWRPEYLITDEGNVFCGGGINSAADLSLYLVEKFCGREVAAECAKALLIEMPRTWQVAFADFSLGALHEDSGVHRAQEWLHQHYAEDVRFDALARHVGMSPRTFARRFKAATGQTPLTYLHGLRITMAKRRLENGRQTIQEVMTAVGYEDPIFFRTLFRRYTGLSPNEYRLRFGRATQWAAAE